MGIESTVSFHIHHFAGHISFMWLDWSQQLLLLSQHQDVGQIPSDFHRHWNNSHFINGPLSVCNIFHYYCGRVFWFFISLFSENKTQQIKMVVWKKLHFQRKCFLFLLLFWLAFWVANTDDNEKQHDTSASAPALNIRHKAVEECKKKSESGDSVQLIS